jgi:hypothetical protein
LLPSGFEFDHAVFLPSRLCRGEEGYSGTSYITYR